MFKTISGSKLADRSKSFFSRLDSFARKSKLIVRRSAKFSAEGFTLGIIKSVLTGKASFNQLAMNLRLSEHKAMTRQALHKRVDQSTVGFMLSATGQAIKERWDDEALIVTKRFNRVIIEDSSQAKTDKRNAEDFPGHGNDKGKTAGCKIDLAFDLLTGEPVLEALHLATEQDRELGKDLVDLVKPFDLILRDMGYFSTDRKSTRLNSSHKPISYAVFCLKKKSTRLNSSHTSIQYPLLPSPSPTISSPPC
mgnify:CR=1 FL=1